MNYCSNCTCENCSNFRETVNIKLTENEKELIGRNKIVQACKKIRYRTGLTLRDVKMAIDRERYK